MAPNKRLQYKTNGGTSQKVPNHSVRDPHRRAMDRSKKLLFSLDGKLYIFGGYDYTNGHYHDSIEVFDPTIQKWETIKQTLPQPLRSFGLCLLKDLVLIDRK